MAVDPRLQNASPTRSPKPLFDLERVMATTKEQPFLATFKLWEPEAMLSWMYGQNNVMSTD